MLYIYITYMHIYIFEYLCIFETKVLRNRGIFLRCSKHPYLTSKNSTWFCLLQRCAKNLVIANLDHKVMVPVGLMSVQPVAI